MLFRSIKIMRKCKGLNWELDNYKFKADEALASGYTGKPVDKDNHGINALEWITMELPSDPKNLLYGVYNKQGRNIAEQLEAEETARTYWALADDTEDNYEAMDETPFDVAYSVW